MALLLNFLFFLETVGEINVDSPKESFKKLFLFVGSKVIFPFFEFVNDPIFGNSIVSLFSRLLIAKSTCLLIFEIAFSYVISSTEDI